MEEAVDLMLDPRHGHHSSISSIHLNNNTARLREVILSISSTEVNTLLSTEVNTHLNSNTEGTVVVNIRHVLKEAMVDINKVMDMVRTTTKETRRRRRRRRTLPRPRIFPRLQLRRKRRKRKGRRRRKREEEWTVSPCRRKE